MMDVLSSCFLVVCVMLVDTATIWDTDRLYKDLIENSGYNKRSRPVLDQDGTVDVNITFSLIAIHTFDIISGELSVVGVMEFSWFDERMAWDPVEYNRTWSMLIPQTEVWKPHLILKNPFESMSALGHHPVDIRFYPDGSTLWITGDLIRSVCDVDISLYPYDVQTCFFDFIAAGYITTEIKLLSENKKMSNKHFTLNGEWTVLDTAMATTTLSNTSVLRMAIKLRRIPVFYIVNYILPVMFLCFLNVFVFILPVESGEKVSYSITMLLSLTVFLTLIGGEITQSSQPMSYMSYFLMTALIVSTIITLLTILIVTLYHTHERNPVSPWIQVIHRILTYKCHKCPRQQRVDTMDQETGKVSRRNDESDGENHGNDSLSWIDVSKKLDRFLFIAFLLFYLIISFGFFVSLEQLSTNQQTPL